MNKRIISTFTLVLGLSVATVYAAESYEKYRWILLPFDWSALNEFQAKGKYFRFPDSLLTKVKRPGGLELYSVFAYADSGLAKSPSYALGPHSIYLGEKKICESMRTRPERPSQHFLLCGDGFCKPKDGINDSGLMNADPLRELSYKLMKSPTESCPLNYRPISSLELAEVNKDFAGRLLPYDRISVDKKSLEITMAGKKYYVDIRGCDLAGKADKGCKEVVVEKSLIEIAQDNLKKVQKERSHEGLNDAIKRLLPWVRSKDKASLQKYFERKAYDEVTDEHNPAIKVDDDILKELEACLNYDHLLPHLKASRGIKLACIFDDSGKYLMNVTYIEALGRGAVDPSFLPK